MSNIINFKDYRRSDRPKKRMIDADALLETIWEYILKSDIKTEERKMLIDMHLFLDMYADLNK